MKRKASGTPTRMALVLYLLSYSCAAFAATTKQAAPVQGYLFDPQGKRSGFSLSKIWLLPKSTKALRLDGTQVG